MTIIPRNQKPMGIPRESQRDPGDRVSWESGLIARVRGGDEQAWRTLYDASFEGLHVYVSWRAAGRRDVTEDVVQETWLTAVRRIASFEPERGSFSGWLRGIAAKLFENRRRRDDVRRRRMRPLNPEAALAEAGDDGPEPEDLARRIAGALTALPPRYEAALRAKYLERRSVAQIAEERSETPKAIESLLTRARDAFREVYRKLE